MSVSLQFEGAQFPTVSFCSSSKKIRVTVNELSAAPDIELDEAWLKRVFDAALAERSAQQLLADEVATKPTGSPATKKAKKGKHKR